MYRNFHTYFWSDPKIKGWPPLARYHFMYLFTNEHTHLSGIYPLKLIYMQEELSLTRRCVLDNLTLFENTKCASYDYEREIIWVHKMLFYQTQGNPGGKNITGIARHLETLHNSPLIRPFLLRYKDLSIPYKIPYGIPTRYPPVSDPDSVPDSDSIKEREKKIHVDDLELTESMRIYASKHGINGHAPNVFESMKRNVIKKGDRMKRTIRQWEAQYQTFVDNAPKFNPEFIDVRSDGEMINGKFVKYSD